MLFMLQMESRKARESFTSELHEVLIDSRLLSSEVLQCVKEMNLMKKGVSDAVLDYEKVL